MGKIKAFLYVIDFKPYDFLWKMLFEPKNPDIRHATLLLACKNQGSRQVFQGSYGKIDVQVFKVKADELKQDFSKA